ncbi:hypothetical protein N7512_007124, partial [Penicillium capsulatum]
MPLSMSFPPGPQDLRTWRDWESLAVTVVGIPREVTVHDLFRAFKKEGTITNIDIFDDRHGKRTSRGRVRFRPPPQTDFWQNGQYEIHLASNWVVKVQLYVEFSSLHSSVPSPVHRGVSYPPEIALKAMRLDFGVLVGKSTTYPMRGFDTQANVVLTIQVRNRALMINYEMPIRDRMPRGGVPEPEMTKFRFKIPFHQLGRLWETTDPSTHNRSLLIILDSPAVHHRQAKDVDTTFSASETSWREGDTWYRQTSMTHGHGGGPMAPVCLRRSGQIVDFGRWNVIKMTFSADVLTEQIACIIHEILKDHNIIIQDGDCFRESDHRPVSVWQWVDSDAKTARDHPLHMLGDLLDDQYVHLAFPVRYQLEVCISNDYLSEFTMSRAFLVKLLELGDAKAQRLLEYVATNKQSYLNPMEIFDLKVVKGVTDSKIPSYCSFMRTARITPTTVYYSTPTVDISNRITRRYIEFADRFLRVRFTDEKTQGRINPSEGCTNDEIFARVKRALTHGIRIGDRLYEFLAFGNSQFRDHGAYFFAPLPNLTASHIRAWMGQFTHIRNVAKHTARLGQCFSTTRAVAGSPVMVTRIPDIIREGYCFSDGVGKISRFLAQMALNELQIKPSKSGYPSAFQFRLGGCKGMLAISPDTNPKEVQIRPSQIKFESEHASLEIIRWSQFGIATLNRQLILVLSALGIPDKIFDNRLDNMLAHFDKAMANDVHATELLQKFVDPNQMSLTVAQMVSDGFRSSKEPFVNSLLALWQAWYLKSLKEKAKIVIDQGANLLGVLDETGTLKEIFVQICRPGKEDTSEIIEGVCIVARNPSLHPGDIRVVRAVNRPELRHFYDVIVFPQTGDRDIPSMCSGGDLDGDDYLVLWDQGMIPKSWDIEPMAYTRQKELELDHDITVNEMTTFFVDYMKNDCLPRIAHAHMAQADWLRDGVLEDKCIRLARLHSDAVDYNKTGRIAVMSRDLAPRKWPHFMEKRFKREDQIYHSRKILGQLYDKVEKIDFKPNLEMPFDARILHSKLGPQSEAFLEFAEDLKTEYDAAMLRIMAQFGIKTEFEVWSTFVLSHNYLCRDYKIHEDLGRLSSILHEGFRRQCYEKVNGRLFEEIAPLAVAMYRVTHKQMASALQLQRDHAMEGFDDHESIDSFEIADENLPLISFPWIFHEVLGKVAQGKSERSPETPQSPVEDNDTLTEEARGRIYTQEDVQRILATFDNNEVTKDDGAENLTEEVLVPSSDERQSKEIDMDYSNTSVPLKTTGTTAAVEGSLAEDIQESAGRDDDSNEDIEEIVEDQTNLKVSAIDALSNLIN